MKVQDAVNDIVTMRIKRSIDKALSEGYGRQLLWLLLVALLCVGVALIIAIFVFNDGVLKWQDVVGLFLDPGVFGSFAYKGHDFFRLTIALMSMFFFSALLVSVFTNVFNNISLSVREGRRKYNLHDHILILGGNHHLQGLLQSLDAKKHDVVVMSPHRPELKGGYIYYQGERDCFEDLQRANADKASTIYIIGEEREAAHDSRSLHSMAILRHLSKKADHDIHCYITLEDQTSTEIFQYSRIKGDGRLLLVDCINDYEHLAEQLLVNTSFLPVIRQGESKQSHIVIIGTGPVAQAVAYTSAHISHYPSFTEKGMKTKITFIGDGMGKWMNKMLSSRPVLFEMSRYDFVDSDGIRHTHEAVSNDGDFLDVEWQFVDADVESDFVRQMLSEEVNKPDVILTVCVCLMDDKKAVETALHLPRPVYGMVNEVNGETTPGAHSIAVYVSESKHIIDQANQTGMYGTITVFGPDTDISHTALESRSRYGKRVNFVYDQKWGNPPSKDMEEAWYKLSESDKYSSVYSANAMFLRTLCYDMSGDRMPIYEAEHRRWVMSELIMGFRPGKKRDKAHFVHNDIIPFACLPDKEKDKDKDIIDAMPRIIKD